MISSLIRAVALTVSVGAVFWSVSAGRPWLSLGLTALVCLVFVVIAAFERARLVEKGASEPEFAAAAAASMGLVWAWAALTILLAYIFVLSWHEWWQYVLGAGAIAAICLFFSGMMLKDVQAGRRDETMLKLARYLTMGQLGGMLIAMVGLVLDDKMPRDPQNPDWAANTVFFFGAAALAVISLNALRGTSSQQS